MFTGIVEDVGKVKEIKTKSKDVLFTIQVKNIDAGEIGLGESVAVNGTCLTVISSGKNNFTVEASRETLKRTNLSKLKVGSKVNLERALKIGGRLGGHIVNGHVDGIGKVDSIEKRGKSIEICFSLPEELSRYVVEKGSVAVDGVSLTINAVNGNRFLVNIIPYTQDATIFAELKPGDLVNIECDIIGKYVEKFVLGKDKKKDIRELIEKL
ncbi:MAG: riboflavin synthase [Deltaproteobacteria bacterium]|nr:riboflavin synthase [Deltaproteobacteria bacterium]